MALKFKNRGRKDGAIAVYLSGKRIGTCVTKNGNISYVSKSGKKSSKSFKRLNDLKEWLNADIRLAVN